MVAGAATGQLSLAAQRRVELAGKGGFKGLVENKRVFGLAVFASLGGLLYGYNQGVFSSVLPMYSFIHQMGDDATNSSKKGWLVAILELGAWFGVLWTGYLADKLSRKFTIMAAVVVFCIGVIVQSAAFHASSIYAGRFITGMGVGSISMAVPLYNGELSPPEVRGSLIALQQMAIVTGIMISFWIDYGTNYIGGTGASQSQAAWRIPLALQLVPALILGAGMVFMPHSPRWLVSRGREEEALGVLSGVRRLAPDSEVIQLEFLEIKAEHLFEKEVAEEMFPQYQDGSFRSDFLLGFHSYLSLLTSRALFRRIAVGCLVMFFQQWTGINAILYYAPSIFKDLGLTGNTISLLATGVVGIVMFLTTIPSVIWLDSLGRKPLLISGAFIMAACHLIVAILTARFRHSWPEHTAAGWVACVLIWIFAAAFGYSWGPCAWVIVAEIFPLSVRGKGLSIAASSNWMNNFIVGQVTPNMIQHLSYGTFIFFGLFSFMGGLFVWFFVPETKGYSLEEMDAVFGESATGGRAAEDQSRLLEIYRRLGLDKLAHGDEKAATDEDDRDSGEKHSVEQVDHPTKRE